MAAAIRYVLGRGQPWRHSSRGCSNKGTGMQFSAPAQAQLRRRARRQVGCRAVGVGPAGCRTRARPHHLKSRTVSLDTGSNTYERPVAVAEGRTRAPVTCIALTMVTRMLDCLA